jgi:putative flippase GtrA
MNLFLAYFRVMLCRKHYCIQTYRFVIFIILSVIGLGINQLVMWIAVDIFKMFYMIAKIGATAIVMVYNFITEVS